MKTVFVFLLIYFPFVQDVITGKVIGISDGDTITILVNNEKIKIRLNGIDCPEKAQDFGNKAKEFTSTACFAKKVTVKSFGKDRYGRTLGDVILPNGINLNKELVRAGLAWHYKKYSTDTVLAHLEILAQQEKMGLWIQPNCIPPWEFRNIKKILINDNY